MGAAVCTGAAIVYPIALSVVNSDPAAGGPGTLVAAAVVAVMIGLPALFLAGATVASLLNIPRPWLVAAGGLLAGGLTATGLSCIIALFLQPATASTPLLIAAVCVTMVGAYAVIAAVAHRETATDVLDDA
ncbi:hypothetical protein [Paractinoplanes toevensis]|uniref:Uncharacterized protein n=1 Tax=Paractinoplanes toevensis TaxID=571911 RepID=A0A919TCD7_9ACTN|nr:hypothetical protein [Actinoplanes toevensis]GIM92221.1 hypothetical protein Ato02nite_040140 [Actinoplanes toevensis]